MNLWRALKQFRNVVGFRGLVRNVHCGVSATSGLPSSDSARGGTRLPHRNRFVAQWRLASCVFLSLFSFACMRGRVPAVELYRLSMVEPVDAVAAPAPSPPLRGGLAVLPYVTRGLYGDDGIVYSVDEVSYGAYPNREWAIPLSEMLGSLTETILKAQPLDRDPAVYDPSSLRGYAYQWRGSVREFEEKNRGRTVLAAVALDAQLVRTRDDSVVWRGTKRVEREVRQGTMPAIVMALSAAANEVIASLVEEARAAANSLMTDSSGSVKPAPD